MKLLAKTFQGLESVLATEIELLGGKEITIIKRGVTFEGDKAMLYKANYELRTALRILVPIRTFEVKNEMDLYKGINRIDWSKYMHNFQTLAVDGVTQSTLFTHSKYIALKTKDAIVDQFREKTGRRPNIKPDEPDLMVNIHISYDNICTVSLDSSGESLHKRNYRQEQVEAPINEVLAAGMVMLSGWDANTPLADGMCGSGTILIEAAMIANKMAAQRQRTYFSFKKWPDFDKELWLNIRNESEKKIIKNSVKIFGSDKNPFAIKAAQRNALAAQVDNMIKLNKSDFFATAAPTDSGILIMNPPYNERLQEDDILGFYKSIGDTLKQSYGGWQAWIISSNPDAIKALGLRTSRKIPLFNGALECRYLLYDLYKGSKKQIQED